MQLIESIRDKMQDSGTRLLEVLHNRKVYERKDENGYARMISQPVFDGIDIIYNDVVMSGLHIMRNLCPVYLKSIFAKTGVLNALLKTANVYT